MVKMNRTGLQSPEKFEHGLTAMRLLLLHDLCDFEQVRADLQACAHGRLTVYFKTDRPVFHIKIYHDTLVGEPFGIADGQYGHPTNGLQNLRKAAFFRVADEKHLASPYVLQGHGPPDRNFSFSRNLSLDGSHMGTERIITDHADVKSFSPGRGLAIRPLDELGKIVDISRLDFVFRGLSAFAAGFRSGAELYQDQRDNNGN
jgi:hypothetical protein